MAKKPTCIDKKQRLLVLDYEQGWMTPEEAQAFERNHLARCVACREDLAYFKPVWADLRERPEIFEEAERLAEQQAERRKQRFSQWTWVTAAAAVAAALLLGMLAYSRPVPSERIEYARLDVRPGTDSAVWRGGPPVEALFTQALGHYQAARYREAADLLQRVLAAHPARATQEQARLALAQSYIRFDKPDESRAQLNALIREAEPKSPYKAAAEALLRKIELAKAAK